ncbi:hypothetical protein H1R20_g13156, partial [Candolleomyces eurysporus]
MTTASFPPSMACTDPVDLNDIFRLNIIPSGTQKALIRRDVATTSAKISELHSELEGLEDRLRRHQLALSSPVRQIPTEILGEIFVHTLPTYPILDHLGRHQLVDIELVCRAWCDAARSNYRLWSGLYVDDSVGDGGLALKPIMDWFSRSGKMEKSLVFEAVHDDCRTAAVECKNTGRDLAKLLAGGPNFTHFEYHSSGPRCFQNFVDAMHALDPGSSGSQAAWDAVKSMVLHFEYRWDVGNTFQFDSMFHRLPSSLTSLKLYLPFDNPDSTFLDIPTRVSKRLTSFNLICQWDEAFILDLLYGGWDNLERLTLYIYDCLPYELDPCKPVVLPKVRSMRLRAFNPSSSDFLQMLTTPRLVKLNIGFEGYHTQFTKDGFAQNILSFLDRSNCKNTLRSLKIRHVDIQVNQLIDLLANLPLLTHLTLAHVTSSEDAAEFFEALRVSRMLNGVKPFLPRLETLELIHFPPNEFPGLFDYIKSRRPYDMKNGQAVYSLPQDSLRRLVVRYSTEDDDDLEKHQCGSVLEGSRMVEELRTWCSIFVDVAPFKKKYGE